MEKTKVQDNKFLGTEKVNKLLRMFAIPCVLSLIIQALYNIVDQIFIGQSGYLPLGNSATGIVYPITVIALALGLFIGDGTAAIISINQGKNKTEDTHKSIGTGISIGLFVSIILTLLCFALEEPLLKFFGASNEGAIFLPAAKEYCFFIFMGFPFYDKELTSLAASESGLASDYIDNIEEKDSILYSLYLSAEANQTAINAQDKILTEIAKHGACVLVGRAADHVLASFDPYKVFVYAPLNYRKKRIMKNYGDTESLAFENIEKADKRRAKFYENVSGKEWGNKDNYNLMVDSSVGIDKAVDLIYLAVKEK